MTGDPILVTTREAAVAVGRTPADIRLWKHRGHITPVYEPGSGDDPPEGFDGRSSVYDLNDIYREDPTHERRPMKNPDQTYQRTVLGALQSRHVYGGTVPAPVVEKRRAKNKTARVARRVTRSKR